MTRTIPLLLAALVLFSGAAFAVEGVKGVPAPPAAPDTSAPDAWGYTWVRSTEPGGPTFQWVDITTRGTLATGLGDDNSVGPFSLGFAFPYYWYEATTFRIGSNGYITFGNQTANFASPFAAMPNTAAPNDMLAICTGDLDFTVAAATPQCYYWTNGVDSLVVSYINVPEWRITTNPNTRHTFQVILLKADSSIIFQYGRQQGRYDDTNNNTLCIGIENQTGQIGLSYAFSATPPHALLPDSGLAIRIKRTTNTGLSVTDAGVVGGFNSENLAQMVRVTVPETVKAIVRNYGTANLTNVRVTYQIVRTGQPTARDTVFLASFPAGEQTTVVFPRLFTPAVAGTYTATFATFISGDVGPSNNTKVTEIVSAAFSTSANTRLAYEGGTAAGSTSWSGGGGFGIDFELPVQRVRIESVYVQIATVTAPSMVVEILDGAGGVPGAVLATRTVNAIVGNNGISFRSDSIIITNGRFFAGARGQLNFSYETAAPISFRTWEYTNGYAPYRSRDQQDIMIRAVVRQVDEPPPPPVDSSWVQFDAGAASGLVVALRVEDDSANFRNLGFGFAEGMNTCIVPADNFGGFAELELPPAPPAGVFDARFKDPLQPPASVCYGEGSTVDLRPVPAGADRDTFLVSVQEGSGGRPIRFRWPSGLGATLSELRMVDAITGGSLFSVNMLTDTTYAMAAPFTSAFIFLQRAPAPDQTLAAVNGSLYGNGCDSIRVTSLTFTWDTLAPPFIVPGLSWMAPESTTVPQVFQLPPTAPGFPLDAHLVYVPWPGGVPDTLNIAPLVQGRRYKIETDCIALDAGIEPVIPTGYAVSQNYPNPFNPSTRLTYTLPEQSSVRIVIYDLLGREIRRLADSETRPAGVYDVTWDGRNNGGSVAPTGTYFLRFEAGSFQSVRKLLLLK
jgi:hypothetical protein